MKMLVRGRPRVAVAYLRASTDEQRLSAAAQRAHIRDWAAREHIVVAGWYVDRAVRSITPIAELNLGPLLRNAQLCARSSGSSARTPWCASTTRRASLRVFTMDKPLLLL
jgi:hypothetical protein